MRKYFKYYLPLVSTICLAAIMVGVIVRNTRVSGPADFAEMAHASEMPELQREIIVQETKTEASLPEVQKAQEIPEAEKVAPETKPAPKPVVKEQTPVKEAKTSSSSTLSDREREILAKLLHGEANSDCVSQVERSMVIWCVFNRVDSGISWFGGTIEKIVTKSGQFTGYHENAPVTSENLALVDDVAARWAREKAGETNVGRTIPREFLFFVTDRNTPGYHNRFYRWSTGGLGGKNATQINYDYKNPIANPY